ncbi:MAG: hypothetical protein AAF206_24840 [Bacteroidota bacterium]
MQRVLNFFAFRNLALLFCLTLAATACQPIQPESLQSGQSGSNTLAKSMPQNLQPGQWHNQSLDFLIKNSSIEELEFATESMLTDLMVHMNGQPGHPTANGDIVNQLIEFIPANGLNQPTLEMMDASLSTVSDAGIFSAELSNLVETLWSLGKNNAPVEDLESVIAQIENTEWTGIDQMAAFYLVDTYYASFDYWSTNDPESIENKKPYIADAVGAFVGYGLAALGGTTAILMPWAGYVTGAMFSFIYDALPI